MSSFPTVAQAGADASSSSLASGRGRGYYLTGFRGMTPGMVNDRGAWVKSFEMVGWLGRGACPVRGRAKSGGVYYRVGEENPRAVPYDTTRLVETTPPAMLDRRGTRVYKSQ